MTPTPSLAILSHPNFVKRPHWGGYLDLYRTNDLVIKILYFAPYGCLSLQKHKHRTEEWTVLHGTLDLGCYYDEELATTMYRNRVKQHPWFGVRDASITIKPHTWHYAQAFNEHAFVLEIQTGLCREDDIERRCFEEVTT